MSGMYGDMFSRYKNFTLYCELNEAYANLDVVVELTNDYMSEFTSFIDESNILNEVSMKEVGKTIWRKILELFKKIRTAFKNFLLNVNYFKNAKLPKQQVDDLEKVLKGTQARTSDGCTTIAKIANFMMYWKKNPNSVEISDADIGAGKNAVKQTYEENINIMMKDLSENIETMKNMEEYKRLTSSEYKYEQNNVVEIPMNNIIADMKKCNTDSTKFEVELEKVEHILSRDNLDKQIQVIANKTATFCRKFITYYAERIRLLNIFFKSAAAGFKATLNNIQNSKSFKTMVATKPANFKIKIKLNKKNIDELSANLKQLQDLNKSGENWSKYSTIHADCCKILRIPKYSNFACAYIDIETKKQKGIQNGLLGPKMSDDPKDMIGDEDKRYVVSVMHYPSSRDKIPVNGRPLYHHARNNYTLTELKPNAIGNNHLLYYPEPRVYVNLNVALNRYGKTVKDFDLQAGINNMSRQTKEIYKITSSVDYIYPDTEPGMGKQASYIITDKPVKIQKIDYEQYKKEVEKLYNK